MIWRFKVQHATVTIGGHQTDFPCILCITYIFASSLDGKCSPVNGGVSLPNEMTTKGNITMKRLIALALVTVGINLSARAQWIVYDPTSNIQQIIDQAQNIAKYIEMINNQVQQIQTLTDQLNDFKHYEDLFGDPKSVLLSTVKPLTDDLRKTELGQTLTTLDNAANGAEAMLYNAGGLFHSFG